MTDPEPTVLSQIHDALLKDILKQAKAGDLDAAKITAIQKVLKENNYSALPEHNKPLREIAKLVPFDDDEADNGPIPFPISK